jgi:hypothetical protein
MPNNFNLTLDTTGPANPTISIESGATYATQQLVNCAIATGDGSTVGYQMKLWGNVDPAYDPNIQTTEVASAWITFEAAKQIKLLSGDGNKTIYLKIRDDVYNESAQISDSVNLNTAVPVVTITGPDVSRISKITGKDTCAFSFVSDVDFIEYKVKVVSGAGAIESAGNLIPVAGGSSNMSESGVFGTATPIACSIKGADLESASSGDAVKIVKVFVKSAAGLWSI